MKKSLKAIFIVLMVGVMLCLCACTSDTVKALNDLYRQQNTIVKDGLIRVGSTSIAKDGSMRYGFLNKKGKLVIPMAYAYASEFNEGLAVVSSDGTKFGYINKKEKKVIPENYTDALPFQNGLAIVKNNEGKYGVIDKKQTPKLGFNYDSIIYVPEKKCFICSKTDNDNKERFGVLDSKGNEVLGFLYKSIVIDEDYAVIEDFDSTFGLIKYSNKKVLIQCGQYVYLDYTQGKVVAGKKNDDNQVKYGLLKTNGKQVHAFDFSKPFEFTKEGYAITYKTFTDADKNVKEYTYLINTNAKEIASSYDGDIDKFIRITPAGYTVFKFNSRYGLMKTSSGKIVLDPIYDDIQLFNDDQSFTLNINGDVSLTTAKGKKILKDTYDGIAFVSGKRYAVISNGRYAFINKKGEKLCEFSYDRIYPCYKKSGMYKIRVENKYGFINKNGKLKVFYKYDYLGSAFIDGITVAGKMTDGVMKYGIIKKNGKELTEFKYDLIGNVF